MDNDDWRVVMLLLRRLKIVVLFIILLLFVFVAMIFLYKSKEEKLASEISKRFFTTVNKTNKPDFYVNGIIIHGYDGYASWKPLKGAKRIGLVAVSYLRKDISAGNPTPVYFHNDTTTEGIIIKPLSKLKGKNKYQVLCFYPTDSDSVFRKYSACGASSYQTLFNRYSKFDQMWAKLMVADLKTTVYSINNDIRFTKLKNSDFANPKLVVEGKTPQITTSFDTDFNNGCKKAGIDSVGKFFEAYNFSSGAGEKLQCSFGATKKYFALGLSVERELLRRYKNKTSLYGKRWNEMEIREWSYLEDKSAPVEVIYYLYAKKNLRYKMSKKLIDDSIANARKWQKEIYEESGKVIPIVRVDMDVVTGVKKSKKVVTYHKEDNLKF